MTTTQTVQTYAIDPIHSNVEFVIRHLMIAKVRGRFHGVTGTIHQAEGQSHPSSVEATIEVDTIGTGDAQRDGHLKSPDFFDVATYPTMKFKSAQVVPVGEGFELHGELTMHGVTKPVTLAASFEGTAKDLYGNHRIAFEAEGKLNRKDYGLVWNAALEAGGVAVGEDVKIELSIQAIAQA